MNKKSSLSRQIQDLLTGDATSTQATMLRYFIVAGIATVCDYSLNVGSYTLSLHWIPSFKPELVRALCISLGFIFGVWSNYILSVRWAFKGSDSGRSHRDQLIFIVTALMGLGINIGLVELFHQLWGLDPRLGRIPAILIAFLWNYYSKKWWVF